MSEPATGVIFDLDGVIVETEQLWERSWVAACEQRGKAWTAENTTNAQGMSLPEWSAYVADVAGVPGQAEQIGEECVGLVTTAVGDGEGPLIEGARELVEAVGARVSLGLASSAARRVIDAVLAQHDLAGLFVATVSSEEVPRGKPSPDVYQEAARRIGLANGDGLVAAGIAIEDSSNGIKAAHAAGLQVVALPNPTYPPKPDSVRLASYVASDHADAQRFILGRLK